MKVSEPIIYYYHHQHLTEHITTNSHILTKISILLPGECCYGYRRFPATPSVCHGSNQTRTVSLLCEVEYSPLNSGNNIEVKWYRSKSEEYAGIEGELLIDENMYIRYNRYLIPVNQTLIGQYILGILNFNASDRGYYWCQVVVNNISLPASPYGFISSSQCTFLDITCTIDQPLCAHNISARYRAHKQMNGNSASCLLKDFNNNILTTRSQIFPTSSFPTTDIVTITMSSFATTEVAPVTTSSFPTTAVVSTIVALIIPLALTILVVSSIIYIMKHKSPSKFNIVMILCNETQYKLQHITNDNNSY